MYFCMCVRMHVCMYACMYQQTFRKTTSKKSIFTVGSSESINRKVSVK